MENKKVKKTSSRYEYYLIQNRSFLYLLHHNKNHKLLAKQLEEYKKSKPESSIEDSVVDQAQLQQQQQKEDSKSLKSKLKQKQLQQQQDEIKEIKMKEKEKDEEIYQELLEEEIDSSLLIEDEPLSDQVIIKQLFNHFIRETNCKDIKFDDSDSYSIKDQTNYYKSRYINNRKKVINTLVEESIVSVDEMTIEKLISYGYDTKYFNEIIPLVDAIEMLKLINSNTSQETVKIFVILESILLFNNNIRAIHPINTHELSNFKKRLDSDISVLVNELSKYINISNNNKKFLVNNIKQLESSITKNYYDEIIKNTSSFKLKDTFNQIESLSVRSPDINLKQDIFKQLNLCSKNSNLYPPEMLKLKSLHIQGHYVNQKIGWKGSNRLLIEYILKQSVKSNQLVDFTYDIIDALDSPSRDNYLLDNNIIQALLKSHNGSLKSITFRLLFSADIKFIKNELLNLNSLIKQSISKYSNIQIIIECNSSSSDSNSSTIKLVNESFKDINYNVKQISNLEVIRFELNHN